MEAWLSVKGEDPVRGLQELDEWLSGEPELRGRIAPRRAQPRPNELGVSPDVLVAAVGAGGAISVLAGSLRAFLVRPRGADVRIVVSSPDGRSVEIDAKRVDDVEALVRQALASAGEGSPAEGEHETT